MSPLASRIVEMPSRLISNHEFQEGKFQYLAGALMALMVASYIFQALYNIFLHPLARIPGPWVAKVSANYLVPASAGLHRAQSLRELHNQYGPVVRVGPNEISVSDWRAYREIYSHKASSKTDFFYRDTSLTGHDNIFTMLNKDAHSGRRKLQNQSYSQQAVFDNEALIVDKAKILVRRLSQTGKEPILEKPVNAFALNGLFSLEVILACAFNRHHGDVPSHDAATLLEAMDSTAVAIRTAAALPFLSRAVGRMLPGPIGRSFKQWDLWQDVTQNLLKEFQQHELPLDKTQKFMATPMLVNEDPYLGRRLTQLELVEELMGITFAGSGTTSSTLTYLLYAMSKDMGRQERLRQELRTVAGTSLNEVKNLPYLNAVLKETFRLYPTIMSTLPRILDRPVNIGDHVLPPGTLVGMQNYVHHRDAELFHRPDEFLPERWLEENGNALRIRDMESALTPFSLGPRNCIGQNLAKAELYLAVSNIFGKLRLQLNADMTEWDVEVEDPFNIAPKGRRPLLDVWVLEEERSY
ncbi:uncharacterized protein A1O5_09501 [Cladophialophora psammophila CBS 110553]|uniref:Cytochrome P450 oxidoreductase n=1 Tax=Cladophialophora psammophila CBS 110553 TaxID=1182543 RepID=W9WHV9_9EURO|nr:uncharacterized protein A1O5_09501 [Cladophialophora psammophila CBS 110553]EXJ67488.1 hypothetical protein A1O5_09501 [Cladophialophora psammophila CBS 110553]